MEIINNPWTITIVGGIIVTIFSFFILKKLKTMPDKKFSIEDSNIAVNSPGAIVGNNINVGTPKRNFKTYKEDIDKVLDLYKGGEIKIWHEMGDAEILNLAKKFEKYLTKKNYQIKMVPMQNFKHTPLGVKVNMSPDYTSLNIEIGYPNTEL